MLGPRLFRPLSRVQLSARKGDVVWDHTQLTPVGPGGPRMEFDSPAFRQTQLDDGPATEQSARVSAHDSPPYRSGTIIELLMDIGTRRLLRLL
jgi:hypothetical protein